MPSLKQVTWPYHPRWERLKGPCGEAETGLLWPHKQLKVGLQLLHRPSQPAQHLQHLQRGWRNLMHQDVQQPRLKLLLRQASGSVNVQDHEQLLHTAHGRPVHDVCGDLAHEVEVRHLAQGDIPARISVNHVKQVQNSRNHLCGPDLLEFGLFLSLLLCMLKGPFDQHGRHQVHQTDRHKSNEDEEIETQRPLCSCQRYIDLSDAVQRYELRKGGNGPAE
mmetsp:Transcript_54825/g.127959  ORF Transcript_54825/g.127959 Transcript_54825/m.127959 type:complete len:220 (-) Transcript_54825:1083-1742(-)